MDPRSTPFVLLVEDSDDDAFFFERALKKCGNFHSYLRLNDGGSALSYLEKYLARLANGDKHRTTILFLDLKLPVYSGFEILQWLREKDALKLFTISILTGSQTSADVKRALELGVSDYLVKPIAVQSLGVRLAKRSAVLSSAADV